MSERIISLTSENIKRLRAIHITPNGQSVEVAGCNGAGKSSVLDSIWYALAGRSVLPDRPIRDGESRAEVTIELDSYTVTRSFTAAGGGTLKVTPKSAPNDGKPIPSPQSFLDGLLSSLTFDPFEFTRLKDAEQGETLRKLLGLDFSVAEGERTALYNKRTAVNRDIESAAIKLKDWMPNQNLVSDEPISISDVMAQRDAAVAKNKANRDKLNELTTLESKHQRCKQEVEDSHRVILEMEHQIVEKKKKHAALQQAEFATAQAAQQFADSVSGLKDEDLSVFDKQILAADEHNAKLKQNRERAALLASKKDLDSESAALTGRMAVIDENKSKALSSAKFPLPGLSFSSSGGVAFNGVPFSQISTAEQIRVSAAIGLSLNPGLKVIFIRNGSLIDDAGLRMLCELAKSHDAQIWIERVGSLSGELPGVVIADGEVSESTISTPTA